MKKIYAIVFALIISVGMIANIAHSQAKKIGSANDVAASGAAIGQTIADFALVDALTNKEVSLASLKGAKGTVLIFVSTQCPVSNAYNERMEKLASDYKARGINVIGINSNATESMDDVKQHAAKHNLTFTILKDKGNVIADRLGAQHTPEAYLLDSNNVLIYHGRIDNARTAANVNTNDLRDAMDAVIAGKPVQKTEAAAFGCSIKRAE